MPVASSSKRVVELLVDRRRRIDLGQLGLVEHSHQRFGFLGIELVVELAARNGFFYDVERGAGAVHCDFNKFVAVLIESVGRINERTNDAQHGRPV